MRVFDTIVVGPGLSRPLCSAVGKHVTSSTLFLQDEGLSRRQRATALPATPRSWNSAMVGEHSTQPMAHTTLFRQRFNVAAQSGSDQSNGADAKRGARAYHPPCPPHRLAAPADRRRPRHPNGTAIGKPAASRAADNTIRAVRTKPTKALPTAHRCSKFHSIAVTDPYNAEHILRWP